MEQFKDSINNYLKTLVIVQQAIHYYSETIGGLLQSVQSIENASTKSTSEKNLSMALNEVLEIERIITQKEILLKLGTNPKSLSLTDRSYASSHMPNSKLINAAQAVPLPINMVHYYMKSHPNYYHATAQVEEDSPLKPWLSQKVYRNAYKSHHSKQEE